MFWDIGNLACTKRDIFSFDAASACDRLCQFTMHVDESDAEPVVFRLHVVVKIFCIDAVSLTREEPHHTIIPLMHFTGIVRIIE